MIFSSPLKFDENEWYVITGLIVLLFLFWFLPKHFPPALTYLILLFTANLGITADYILATDYPNDFYDALDTPKFDLFDFIMSNINYGLIGYFFMYFFDRFELKGSRRILYIIFWILLSLLLEFIGTKLNVFTYKNWNLWLSLISYILIFTIYLLFLKLAKFAYHRMKSKLD